MQQLFFPFQTNNQQSYTEEDFIILPQNSEAYKFFERFFLQNDFSSSSFKSAILEGLSSGGKTHLLHIFAQKYGAEFLLKKEIENPHFQENHFYILEDFEEGISEEKLLHLINLANEHKAFLILSAKEMPQFKLKDLTSRLKNIFSIKIAEPDSEAIKQLLVNQLSRRQIKLSRQAIDFISLRIDRNYEAVLAAIKLIDNIASEDMNIKKIREVFGSM